jgi:hypothetical protein
VKLLGVYPNDVTQAAGIPGAAIWQSNPSIEPEPVQAVVPHSTSFWPVVLTHLPLLQSPSLPQ